MVASWVALILYVAGLILAFGLRTWAHWRATGSTGFRGISGAVGSMAWWGGALFAVALVLGVAAPILAVTGVFPPWSVPLQPVVALIGLVVGVAGLVLTLVAQQAMGSSWRIGVDESERTQLVRTGVFGRVRNPIFTGMVMVSAGMMLLVPAVLPALSLVCLVIAVQIQVRVTEEPYLARIHGPAYGEYAAHTGRFLPKITRS